MREVQLNHFYKGIDEDIDVHGRESSVWSFPTINYRVFNKEGQGLILTTLNSNTREIDNYHPEGQEFSLPEGYMACGAGEFNGIMYIVSYNKNNGMGQIGSFPSPNPFTNEYEDVYRPLRNFKETPLSDIDEFTTTLFNFSKERMVDIIIKDSYDSSMDIYMCDYENPNRVINSGFKKDGSPNGRYYTPEDFNGVINQIPSSGKILKADLEAITEGGELMYGNYYMYIRYLTADFNPTSFVAHVGVMQVYKGSTIGKEISGGSGVDKSNKRILLNLSNIDTTYRYVEVGFVRYFGDQSGVLLTETGLYDKKYTIIDSTMQIEITGREIVIPLTPAEILRPNIIERSCKSHTQIDNRYIGANWKSPDKNSNLLSQLALHIKPKPHYTIVDASETSPERFNEEVVAKDVTSKRMQYHNYYMTFDRVGYFRGEIYAFTAGFKFKDGSKSNVFPITGKNFTKSDGADYEVNDKGIVQFPFHEQTVYGEYAKLFDSNNKLRIQGIEFDMTDFIVELNGMDEADKIWFANNVEGIFFARAKRREWLQYQGMSIMCSNGQGYTDDIYKTDVSGVYHYPYGIQVSELYKNYSNNNIDKGAGRYKVGKTIGHLGVVDTPEELNTVFHFSPGESMVHTIGVHLGKTGLWRNLKAIDYTSDKHFYDHNKVFGFIDRNEYTEDDIPDIPYGKGYMPFFVHHIPMMCNKMDGSGRMDSKYRAFYSIRGYINPLKYGLYSPDFIFNRANPSLDNIRYARNCGQTSVDKLDVDGETPLQNTGMHEYWDMNMYYHFHIKENQMPKPDEDKWWNWDKFAFPVVRWANVRNMEHRTDLITATKLRTFDDDDTNMIELELATKVGENDANMPRKNSHTREFVNQATEFGHGENEENVLGGIYNEDKNYWISNRSAYTPKYIGLEPKIKITGNNNEATIYESLLHDNFFNSKYNLDLTLTNLYEIKKPGDITTWYSSIHSEVFYKIGKEVKIEYNYSQELFNLEGSVLSITRYYGDCFLQRTFIKQMTWESSKLTDRDTGNKINFCVSNTGTPPCDSDIMTSEVIAAPEGEFYRYVYAHGVVLGIVTENNINTAMRFCIEPHSYFPRSPIYPWALQPLNLEGQEQFLINAGYNETLGYESHSHYDELAPYEVNIRPTRIRYSFANTPYSFVDGYRQFDIDAFQDYELSDGPINSVRAFLSTIVSIQDMAINLHKHGRDEITVPSSEGDLLLGKADYLSPYVSKVADYGTQHQFSVIVTDDGVYGVDWKMKIIWRLGQERDSYGRMSLIPIDVSKNGKIQKWVHDYAKEKNKIGSDILAVYNDLPQMMDSIVAGVDKEYDEVFFTFLDYWVGIFPCDNIRQLLKSEEGYDEDVVDSSPEIEYDKEYVEGMIYHFSGVSGRNKNFACEQTFIINEPEEGEEEPSLNPYDYPEYFINLGDLIIREFDKDKEYEREWIFVDEDDIPDDNMVLRDLLQDDCSSENGIIGLMMYIAEKGKLNFDNPPDNMYKGNGNDCFIKKKMPDYRTLAYSFTIKAFVGEYSFGSHIYPNIRNELYSFNLEKPHNAYRHNQIDDYLTFYNREDEAVLSINVAGVGDKGLQFLTKLFDNISIHTNHIPFNYIKFETENQKADKIPFDSLGIEFWSDPEWLENKYYMPIQCSNIPNDNEFEDDSQMRGTYLKVTMAYRGREQKYIKSILTEFTISEA